MAAACPNSGADSPRQGNERARLFRHGVASGDPTRDSIVLWTRVSGRTIGANGTADDVSVTWQIRRDDAPGGRAQSGTSVASSAHDGTVHVLVTGLAPGTRYTYSFEAVGERVSGSTATLPDAAKGYRIAVVCCSRWGWPGTELFLTVADERPDLVLHLGDSIYEVGEIAPVGGVTEPPWDCWTLDDYRRRHASHRLDPDLQRLHAAAPFIMLWDDHEVADNAPGDEARERRRAGQRAWFEWTPTRALADAGSTGALGAPEPSPLDRQISISELVDIAVADTRFGGRHPADTDGPSVTPTPGPILNDAQWEQLERFAADSTAPWFIAANQVQVGPMTLGVLPRLGWPPWRRVVNPDQWDGFPVQRRRLYQALDSVAGRPVVLSGDLHSAWSRTLRDRRRNVAHEFTSPSISGETYADAFHNRTRLPSAVLRSVLRGMNRGVDLLDVDRHGFVILDITPDELTSTFVMAHGDRRTVSLDAAPASGTPATR